MDKIQDVRYQKLLKVIEEANMEQKLSDMKSIVQKYKNSI